MKRILCLATALVILATTLSGCALTKKLTAFGLYSRAVLAIREAGGFEADGTVTATFDQDLIENANIKMNFNLKKNGDDSRIQLTMANALLSTKTVIGEDVYVETLGQKLRYTRTESSSEKAPGSFDASIIPDIAEEIFKSIDIIESDDGSKSVTVIIDDDTLYDLVAQMTQGNLSKESGIEFDDATVTMKFDENNDLDAMQISSDISYELLKIFELHGNLTIDCRFINIGTAPQISAPDDAEEYAYSGEYAE